MPDPIKPTGTNGASALIARLAVCALLLGIGFEPWNSAKAQAMTAESAQPWAAGVPLNSGSDSTVLKSGIPLGSVELATPGISPTLPSPNAARPVSPDCSSRPSGGLFDGGGLSVGRSMLCGPRAPQSGQGVAETGVPHTGLPMGSTELGDNGLSGAQMFPLPSVSPLGSTPMSSTGPCPPVQGATTATPASSGC